VTIVLNLGRVLLGLVLAFVLESLLITPIAARLFTLSPFNGLTLSPNCAAARFNCPTIDRPYR